MKRALVVGLLTALVAGSLLGPAQAKKKKPPKPVVPVQVDLSYFLRRDGADCADPTHVFLSLTDAEDIDPGSCGNNFYGVLGDAAGTTPMVYATRDADGVPVTLDATKEITGLIGVKSKSEQATARLGVGITTLHIELIGVSNGAEKTIGTADVEYQVQPGDMTQVYEVEFVMKPDTALDKAVFTSLSLSLQNTGTSHNHGYYTTDNPASYFKIGAWQ
ncbi:MAG: hypothetical protein M3273_01445 [Actinomycetota bacterium]|nr:hypothetical protein [Actinomycetota bacterium]